MAGLRRYADGVAVGLSPLAVDSFGTATPLNGMAGMRLAIRLTRHQTLPGRIFAVLASALALLMPYLNAIAPQLI